MRQNAKATNACHSAALEYNQTREMAAALTRRKALRCSKNSAAELREIRYAKRAAQRSGQAALEYLVTYGWGFLIILLVVGGMAYFGYLSPSRYTPARCDTGVQLECVDYQLRSSQTTGSTEQVFIQFRNGLGDDVNVSRVYFFDDTAGIVPGPGGVLSSIKRGNNSAVFLFILTTTNRLPREDRVSVPIIVEFSRNVTGAPLHNVTGEIFATVQ